VAVYKRKAKRLDTEIAETACEDTSKPFTTALASF